MDRDLQFATGCRLDVLGELPDPTENPESKTQK